ncbi:MAG: class I SAM-dependent methyltransferase [Planctomycetota bacterium]|nr:MAG: class I SAM-dependent methyltransferase [Planctomycetota bacterium]
MKISNVRKIIKEGGLKGLKIAILEKLLIKLKKKKEFIDISDTYINWLAFANAGMLNRGNLFCIDFSIKNLPKDSVIVEVGSFCGLSTNIITYYKRKHSVKTPFFTCDRWEFEGAEKGGRISDSSITYEEYRDFVMKTFERNVKTFSEDDMPHTIEMFSDEFFEAWGKSKECVDFFGKRVRLGGEIGFCFIDGNHTYDYARRDFENTDRFLAKGGYILFDDSSDDSDWEVCKVVEEVLRGAKYELVVKNPNYLLKKK